MGGSSVPTPSAPDQTVPLALTKSNLSFANNLFNMGLAAAPMQQTIALDQFKGGQQLANLVGSQGQETANRMLGYATSQPLETWTPDIFGNQGALTKSAQVSAINAFKSKELEKQANAPAAQAREQITQAAADMVTPDYWQKQMDQWGKTQGLQAYLGTGLQDSTIGKSGFYDLGTQQGQAFRAQNLATAKGIIGEQPLAGLDPATAVGQLQAADAKAMQDRAAYRAGILGATEQAGQAGLTAQGNAANAYQQGSGMYAKSTSDWINQLMGGYSQLGQSQLGSVGNFQNKASQDWQNYQQGMMQAAAQNQSSQNALLGAGIGALGTIGGAAIGSLAGPMGTMAGSALGGALAKSAMPSGGFTAQTSAPMAVQQKYGWGQFSPSNSYA